MATDPADRWSMERVRQFLASPPDATAAARATETVPVPPDRTMELSQAVPAAAEDRTTRQPVAEPTSGPPPGDLRARAGTRAGAAGSPVRARRPGLLRIVAAVVVARSAGAGRLGGGPRHDRRSGGRGATSDGKPSKSAKQPDEPTEEEMTSFVEDYLATVTTDPASSWKRLTPRFPEGQPWVRGLPGLLGDHQSASPSNVRADPEAMTVSYSVVYAMKNGKISRDNVTLALVETRTAST